MPSTSAQSALASRVTGSMLRAFGDVLTSRLSLAIEPTTSKDVEAGAAVVLPLAMEGGGAVLLALPLSAVARDEEAAEPQQVDSGIAAAMTDAASDAARRRARQGPPPARGDRPARGRRRVISSRCRSTSARASARAGRRSSTAGRPRAVT
ncbi:MAG: hypothetical protein KF782_00500 [Labilithrix sp.]|nr:hypothetical protein [Labilithrix sp.]